MPGSTQTLNLADARGIIAAGGGVPIRSGETVIGAVGASGGMVKVVEPTAAIFA